MPATQDAGCWRLSRVLCGQQPADFGAAVCLCELPLGEACIIIFRNAFGPAKLNGFAHPNINSAKDCQNHKDADGDDSSDTRRTERGRTSWITIRLSWGRPTVPTLIYVTA